MLKSKSESLAYAFRFLQVAFIAGLIISGVDKFAHQMADWSSYLSDEVQTRFGCKMDHFFAFIGILEIVLGVGLFIKTHFFALLTSIWFFLCAINLFATQHHYEMALHYAMLGLAALALMKLTHFLLGKHAE